MTDNKAHQVSNNCIGNHGDFLEFGKFMSSIYLCHQIIYVINTKYVINVNTFYQPIFKIISLVQT